MTNVKAWSLRPARHARCCAQAGSVIDRRGREIRVNLVSPGVVPTPGYDLMGLSKEQVAGFVDGQVNTIPHGRVGTTHEISNAVMFLVSDDSSFVNGVELFVDGGMT